MENSIPLTKLILASASPRRRELVKQLLPNIDLIIKPSSIEEQQFSNETPRDQVIRLAQEKCISVAQNLPKDIQEELVLASDTEIVIRNKSLGKPSNPEEAANYLSMLSGKTHEALTGICLKRQGDYPCFLARVVSTAVTFRELNQREIELYVASGEFLDKAGGYGIQGLGAALVSNINGSYSNIVGLPLETFYEMLCELGYQPFAVAKS
jgi:septum formation protein